MKIIDKGYYYDVYDVDDTTVLKKRRRMFSTILFLCVTSFKRLQLPFKYIQYFLSMTKDMEINYSRIPKEAFYLLGNPVFINALEYKQDKCVILKNSISTMSESEFKRWIDEYLEVIRVTWSCGFSDLIFNFTVNTGRDKNGRLVQVDFNEISFDKKLVIQQIQKKYWIHNYSYTSLPPNFKKIWEESAEKSLNEEQLAIHWGNAQVV